MVGRLIVKREEFGNGQTRILLKYYFEETGKDHGHFSQYPVVYRIFETQLVMTMLDCYRYITLSTGHC